MDIDKLAHLSRLELTAEEKTAVKGRIESILEYFDRLKAVDVEGVEPSAHPFPVFADLREDSPGPTLALAALERNAPKWKDDCVVVPRVVDDGN